MDYIRKVDDRDIDRPNLTPPAGYCCCCLLGLGCGGEALRKTILGLHWAGLFGELMIKGKYDLVQRWPGVRYAVLFGEPLLGLSPAQPFCFF